MRDLVKKRPNFGLRQIRKRDGLWIGRKVVEVILRGRHETIVTIEKAPYQDENGDWLIDVSWGFQEKRLESHTFLADRSVEPYKNNQWNNWNCFKRRYFLFPWI